MNWNLIQNTPFSLSRDVIDEELESSVENKLIKIELTSLLYVDRALCDVVNIDLYIRDRKNRCRPTLHYCSYYDMSRSKEINRQPC